MTHRIAHDDDGDLVLVDRTGDSVSLWRSLTEREGAQSTVALASLVAPLEDEEHNPESTRVTVILRPYQARALAEDLLAWAADVEGIEPEGDPLDVPIQPTESQHLDAMLAVLRADEQMLCDSGTHVALVRAALDSKPISILCLLRADPDSEEFRMMPQAVLISDGLMGMITPPKHAAFIDQKAGS